MRLSARAASLLLPLATLLFVAPLANGAAPGGGPVNRYVLTAGDQLTSHVVQGPSVLTSFAQASFEYPVAVNGTIWACGASFGAPATEYDFAGIPTGATAATDLSDSFYDGASDGTFNYAVAYGSGVVYRTNLDWSGATVLFDTGNGFGYWLGSTFDRVSGTLWLSGWDNDTIANYALDGTLLGSFNVGASSITALAIDPSDGTLWFGHQDGSGTYENWSTAGVFLGSVTYPAAVAGTNVLGGEIEPVTDTVPPTVSCTVTRRVLWPASLGLLDVGLQVTAADDSGNPPTIDVRVFSDEAVGALAPDATWAAPSLRCRAERATSLGSNGRVYLVVVRATDGGGNSATAAATVVVPLNLTALHLTSLRAEATAAEGTWATTGLPPVGWFQVLPAP